MKRGTALKWMEALKVADAMYKYDNSQFGYTSPDGEYRSPVGVLLESVCPDMRNVAWDQCSYTWFSEQFFLSENFKKRNKVKSEDLNDWFEQNKSFASCVKLVEDNYETM